MSTEADPATARLWQIAGLAAPMAIRVMATLRLADRLAEEPATAAELADRAGADPGALARLLQFLAVRQVVTSGPDGRYTLTELGEVLRDDHPAGLRSWFDIEGAGRPELAFVQLLHSIRTGEAAYPAQFGSPIWQDLAAHPAAHRQFQSLLSARMRTRIEALTAGYDWAACQHVVDVGGGEGTLLAALLRAHPGLSGTVVDAPETAAVARRQLAAAGLSDRAEVVEGSFFDPLPAGADVYLLSLVLHNWDDRGAVQILRRCAAAMRPQGTVLVAERIGDAGGYRHTGMDLRMLAYFGGRERTVPEIGELAARAGLRPAGAHPAGELTIVRLIAVDGGER